MATKASIMAAIDAKVGRSPKIWRIGLTHDPVGRRMYWTEEEKRLTTQWAQWEADSRSDAQEIEAHFISRGMQGGSGEYLSPRQTVWVYVF